MKHSKEQLSGPQIAALRIFSAGVVLLPFSIVHLRKISWRNIPLIIVAGVTGNLLPAFLYATAIANNIDSSLASILNSLTPIFVVIFAIVVFRDKIRTQKIIGVFVGFAGLALLFVLWKGINFEHFKYASFILLATVLYGININLVAHFLKEINPLHVATISLAFMTIPTSVILWQKNFFQLAFSDSTVQRSIVDATVLGIAGSAIATAIFYLLIKRAGGLFASLVTYGVPFIGIFWGIMDNEPVTVIEIGCLGIILLGVYLVNRPEKKQNDPEVSKMQLADKTI
jgi:drug/metabolite transporter (DMT)-like permease